MHIIYGKHHLSQICLASDFSVARTWARVTRERYTLSLQSTRIRGMGGGGGGGGGLTARRKRTSSLLRPPPSFSGRKKGGHNSGAVRYMHTSPGLPVCSSSYLTSVSVRRGLLISKRINHWTRMRTPALPHWHYHKSHFHHCKYNSSRSRQTRSS